MLEVLQQATGVKMLHVPYKSGAESLTAVMSGNTDVTAISAVTATGYIQAGQIRPYAVTSSRRLANLPDIPTAKEALGQDVEGGSLSGIAAPAGTPPEVVARLNAAIAAVAGGAMAQDKIYARGSERMDGSQEAFTLRVAQEQKKWAGILGRRASKGAACGAAGNGSRVSGAVPSLPSRIPVFIQRFARRVDEPAHRRIRRLGVRGQRHGVAQRLAGGVLQIDERHIVDGDPAQCLRHDGHPSPAAIRGSVTSACEDSCITRG